MEPDCHIANGSRRQQHGSLDGRNDRLNEQKAERAIGTRGSLVALMRRGRMSWIVPGSIRQIVGGSMPGCVRRSMARTDRRAQFERRAPVVEGRDIRHESGGNERT
jgi:hypothetical protein